MHYTNMLSLCFERFARYRFHPRLQRWINAAYVKIFDVKLDEFDTLASFPNLNALFTRSLVKMRPFDKAKFHLIAPCDSRIMEMGLCQEDYAMQIKGKSYRVSDFVRKKLEEGYYFVNFYLSPRDYHRFHAPLNLKVKHLEFIQGKLLSVCEKSLLKHNEVFTQNKRVVLECEDEFGESFYLIAVGALNVGKIQINFAPEVVEFKESQSVSFEPPISLQKGDEIGSFLMGSTIVLLTKNWHYDLKIGEEVYFGQCIAAHSSKTQTIESQISKDSQDSNYFEDKSS